VGSHLGDQLVCCHKLKRNGGCCKTIAPMPGVLLLWTLCVGIEWTLGPCCCFRGTLQLLIRVAGHI
jgi:hypothetical protein